MSTASVTRDNWWALVLGAVATLTFGVAAVFWLVDQLLAWLSRLVSNSASWAEVRPPLPAANRVRVVPTMLEAEGCPCEQIVCLVIDEAHRATGNYAFVTVVKEVSAGSQNFRVLALSATPGSAGRVRHGRPPAAGR